MSSIVLAKLSEPIRRLTFSGDGRTLAGSSGDGVGLTADGTTVGSVGSVSVWRLFSEWKNSVDNACRRVGRGLTSVQRTIYGFAAQGPSTRDEHVPLKTE